MTPCAKNQQKRDAELIVYQPLEPIGRKFAEAMNYEIRSIQLSGITTRTDEPHCFHAGIASGGDSSRRILDHDTLVRRNTQSLSS